MPFYVSPFGNDAAAGTLAAPFRTLDRAQTAMRGGSGGGSPGTETIGGGTIATAAIAPDPTAPTANVGTGWVAVKNWNFGTQGTIKNNSDLDGEFNYHDEFGIYSGAGGNYGSLTIATSAGTASGGQPVEDPARPVRTFTPTEMQTILQNVNASASTVSSGSHDCVNGSIYSKFSLPNAGSLLGDDILWEFKVRILPVQAYWAACWTEGQTWDGGAEIDVFESYGWDHGSSNNFDATNFHSDAVWKVDGTGSSSATSLNFQDYPGSKGSSYHRFDFLYRRDNTWEIWCDDVLINSGTEQWTETAATGATPAEIMYFQHDFAWGFNGSLGTVGGVINQGMSPSNFPVSNFAGKSYGIEYSRVYLRSGSLPPGADKVTNILAGTYNRTGATLVLTAADNGETWQNYAPDGVNRAVIECGNRAGSNGILISGGSNITISGLLIQNCDTFGIGIHGGPDASADIPAFTGTVATASGNRIINNIVHDIWNSSGLAFNAAGISVYGAVPNTLIDHNAIYNSVARGIGLLAGLAGSSDISNSTISNNVLLATNTSPLNNVDSGAIHTDDRNGGSSTNILITNNFIRDYGNPANNLNGNASNTRGIYLDDNSSNFSVTRNIIAGGGTQAFLVHSGSNNTIAGNLIDLGATATIAVMLYSNDLGGTMPGNVFTGNIIISGYTGVDRADWSGVPGLNGAYVKAGSTAGTAINPTVASNLYHNYAGGTIDSGGNVFGDASPVSADPQISGWTYLLAGTSPAYSAPVNFQPIAVGWGPPGYVIPQSGTPPSSPATTVGTGGGTGGTPNPLTPLTYMIGIKMGAGITSNTTVAGWLGRPLDIIGGTITTNNFLTLASPSWVPTNTVLDISFPMLSIFGEGTLHDMAQAASGGYDATFTSMAQFLAGWPNPTATFAPGWEMSGQWYAWSMPGPYQGAINVSYANYIAAYKRISIIMKNHNPRALSQFCFAIGRDPTPYWPGAYNAITNPGGVDVISCDFYQSNVAGDLGGTRLWQDTQSGYGGLYNLDWMVAFAQAQGVKVGLREYGAGPGNGADQGPGSNDGVYVAASIAWMNSLPAGLFLFQLWSNDPPADDLVTPGANPAEQQAWINAWGQSYFNGTWWTGAATPSQTNPPPPTPLPGPTPLPVPTPTPTPTPAPVNPNAFYVSTTGNDANPGSAAAPFLTLEAARAAMQASAIKLTYLRAGTYNRAAIFTLSNADNGTTYSYYPPDGYDTAFLDGGSTSQVTGTSLISILGASNITIDGLGLQNFQQWGIGLHGGATDPVGGFPQGTLPAVDSCVIRNCFIDTGFTGPNNAGWAGGGIWANGQVTNLKVFNNVVQNQFGSGIRAGANGDGASPLDDLSGLDIENNVVLNTNIYSGDNGAIYYQDQNFATTNVTIRNNFIRDYQGTNGSGVDPARDAAIYFDRGAGNCNCVGNIIAGTHNAIALAGGHSTQAVFMGSSHGNNVHGNIIDLGTTAWVLDVAYNAYQVGDLTSGNSITGNLFFGNWAGGQLSGFFGVDDIAFAQGGSPTAPTCTNNVYHNYGSGTLSTTGNGFSDANPLFFDPLISGYTYDIAATSPVYNTPVNFPPLVRNWGPPGYVIPQTGTAPSSPRGATVPPTPTPTPTPTPPPGPQLQWVPVLQQAVPTIAGAATTVLAAAPYEVFDRTNTVRVALDYGTLASVAEIDVLNGQNIAMLGSELIGFATANLVSTGVYDLSDLLRGIQGSDWAIPSHSGNDRFIKIANDGSVLSLPLKAGEVGLLRHYRGVSTGSMTGIAGAIDVPFASNCTRIKPLAPVFIVGARDDNNNLSISWTPRARLNAEIVDGTDVGIDEPMLLFAVDIYAGPLPIVFSPPQPTAVPVVRTKNVTAPTAFYSAAEQLADGLTPGDPVTVRIYQISNRIGRGYPGQATV